MKESPGPLRTFPELSGCPESALLHGSGLFLSFYHGGYRVAGVPLRCPAGACPLGRSSVLPLVLILPPIPPPPSPAGKGVPKSLFRRGLRPRHPGTEPPTTLTDPSIQVPCGKLAFLRHGFPPPQRVPTLHLKPKELVSHTQCQCRARSAPGDARGEAPCMK